MKLSEIWVNTNTVTNIKLFSIVEAFNITVNILDREWKQISPYKKFIFCIMSSPIKADILLVSGRWGIK